MFLDPEQTKALEDRWRAIKEILIWFVTEAPLYRIVKVPHKWPPKTHVNTIMPDTVDMFCEHCKLEPKTTWDKETAYYIDSTNIGRLVYKCRNCKRVVTTFFCRLLEEGDGTPFQKIGRNPAFQIYPPKELGEALGPYRDLYIQGKTLRHNNYGLGALLYFRRLVEETTEELLDLLKATLEELPGDHSEELKAITEAKEANPFENKVKIAAKALPPHLRPGGRNPLGELHKQLSYNIHGGTDEDAIEVVDRMDKILTFLFTHLKAHMEESKEFLEGLKDLTTPRD